MECDFPPFSCSGLPSDLKMAGKCCGVVRHPSLPAGYKYIVSSLSPSLLSYEDKLEADEVQLDILTDLQTDFALPDELELALQSVIGVARPDAALPVVNPVSAVTGQVSSPALYPLILLPPFLLRLLTLLFPRPFLPILVLTHLYFIFPPTLTRLSVICIVPLLRMLLLPFLSLPMLLPLLLLLSSSCSRSLSPFGTPGSKKTLDGKEASKGKEALQSSGSPKGKKDLLVVLAPVSSPQVAVSAPVGPSSPDVSASGGSHSSPAASRRSKSNQPGPKVPASAVEADESKEEAKGKKNSLVSTTSPPVSPQTSVDNKSKVKQSNPVRAVVKPLAPHQQAGDQDYDSSSDWTATPPGKGEAKEKEFARPTRRNKKQRKKDHDASANPAADVEMGTGASSSPSGDGGAPSSSSKSSPSTPSSNPSPSTSN